MKHVFDPAGPQDLDLHWQKSTRRGKVFSLYIQTGLETDKKAWTRQRVTDLILHLQKLLGDQP